VLTMPVVICGNSEPFFIQIENCEYAAAEV
jgi:hypothetical protein